MSSVSIHNIQCRVATHSLRLDLRIRPCILHPFVRSWYIDNPVDIDMRNVNTLGAEFPGQALRERAQSELAGGESSGERRPFHCGSCAGEDECGRML